MVLFCRIVGFFIFAVHCYALQPVEQYTWSCQSVIRCNGVDSIYKLEHQYIVLPSFILSAQNQKITPPYRLNALKGEITFATIPDSGSVFIATYQVIPVQLKQIHRHWTITDSLVLTPEGEKSIIAQVLESPKNEVVFEDRLQKNGSIFRGISIGTNQGMQLISGLRLNVSGAVAPGVMVTASLTDQNTPIQPEGNTQTLQEIDKVFIHITAPHVETTLGDLLVEHKGPIFGAYRRKLQGATGKFDWSNGEVTLTAAATKGEFTSNFFNGQEGNQGPYQLSGNKGQREMIVLAGTETVWIDGESMVRGEDNDYTIDYATGQILFTRKRLITDESRIRIDFEYSDQKFQKSVYGITSLTNLLDGKLTLATTLLREADDKNNPLDETLDENDLDVLQNSGDASDLATGSGAQWVGEEKGAYRKQTLDGVEYYQYAGVNQGDYFVRFSYVGNGNGDYSFQGYGIYRYEGQGLGDYAAIDLLPLATHHQFADMEMTYHVNSNVEIGIEGAISDQDLNLFSSLDDQNNIGSAYTGLFKLKQQPIRIQNNGLGQISINGNIKSIDDQFRSLGQMSEVEHGRKWGEVEGQTWGEDSRELNVVYQPNQYLQFDTDWGKLNRGSDLDSRRQSFAGQLHFKNIKKLRFHSELIESDKSSSGDETSSGLNNYWLRQSGSFEGQWMGMMPGIAYQGEHRRAEVDSAREGFQFQEWTGSMAVKKGAFQSSFQRSARTHQVYELHVLNDDSYAQTDKVTMGLRFKNGFTTEGQWIHRNRDYTDPTREDKISNLSDMKMAYVHPKRIVNAQVHYQFSSSQISQMVTDTLKVGSGLGQYRFDEILQELVPDMDGDLLVRRLQTGAYTPVHELQSGVDIRMSGSRLKTKWMKGIKTRLRWRVERKDKQREFQSVNHAAYQPQWGRDSTVISGLWSLLQDVEYTIPKQGTSFRYRYRKDNSENHQLIQEGILRQLAEHHILIKGRMGKQWGLYVEVFHRNEMKDYFSRPTSSRDIELNQWQVELSFRPKQVLELALQTKLRFAKDFAPSPVTEVTSYFWKPRISYAIQQKGQLRMEAEFGQVDALPETRTLPYEMLSGDQPGKTFRWTVNFSYRLSGHVTASVQYRGRKEPWREGFYQTGQMEVRAFF